MHGLAPHYLAELCVPVADVPGRHHLRSASRGLLDYPRYKLSNYGRRAFSHAGPYYWNSSLQRAELSFHHLIQMRLKNIAVPLEYASSALETILLFGGLHKCTI